MGIQGGPGRQESLVIGGIHRELHFSACAKQIGGVPMTNCQLPANGMLFETCGFRIIIK